MPACTAASFLDLGCFETSGFFGLDEDVAACVAGAPFFETIGILSWEYRPNDPRKISPLFFPVVEKGW
jgi:hypothetical protein